MSIEDYDCEDGTALLMCKYTLNLLRFIDKTGELIEGRCYTVCLLYGLTDDYTLKIVAFID